jgi:hypothetical protein
MSRGLSRATLDTGNEQVLYGSNSNLSMNEKNYIDNIKNKGMNN